METQSPSIESFSYSWLTNLNPSSYSFDESTITTTNVDSFDQDEASFIEMDPRLPPSKRFIRVSSDFCFDFPVLDSSLTLVHADELISNGYVVPLVMKDKKVIEQFDRVDDYYMSSAGFVSSCVEKTSSSRVRCASLRRCQRVSKRFFKKYLAFLFRPFLKKRRGNNINGFVRNSDFSSPRTSVAYSADENWRRSCDSESSIIEAVLHCKRNHGK